MKQALKNKINLLIQLALIDGELDIRERSFIYNVCIRNGLDLDTIGDMIDQPEPIGGLSELSLPARIDYITDCLVLTLIDGKVLPRETAFVMNIAAHLGFEKNVMERLIEHISGNMNISRDNLHHYISAVILDERGDSAT